MESAVIQSVHCPSCDTRYGLARARLRPGIRRARCFKCATVFGVEAQVMILIGEDSAFIDPSAQVAAGPAPVADYDSFDSGAFDAFDAASLEAIADLEPAPALEAPVEPAEAIAAFPAEGDLELPSLEELEAATEAIEPDALQEVDDDFGDVLSADDLLGAESEILDTTLVDYQAPAHPESRPTPATPLPAPPIEAIEDEATMTQGGYSSAKDAIAKLLGETPPPAPAYRPPSHRGGGASMDVEATLTALESTLGGVPTPAPIEPLSPTDLAAPAGATMKLTRAEMSAAMTSMGAAVPSAPPVPAPRPATSESTVMLKMPVSEPLQPSMDPNLLKVQMGTELYSNLSMDQLISLAEQGRLAEYHMVARQFSDNWLEASKVPGLRPVFERLRRSRMPEPPPSSPLETAPIKKSLFGGLFGKN